MAQNTTQASSSNQSKSGSVGVATNKAGPTAVGNATQTLIPDRSQWTEPKLTNIKVGGQ